MLSRYRNSYMERTYGAEHCLRNNERLLALKDIHAGRRAFIIGNGPSLRIEDLGRLKNEITFASNRIYLAFDQTDWRPTYYSICDIVVARENHDAILALDLTKIFANSVRPVLIDDPNGIFVNPKPAKDDAFPPEGWDLLRGTNAGHSVANLAIKIAFWMGIRELYAIGMDHNFVVPETRTGEIVAENEVIVSEGERNHFHAGYRKKGEKWTMPKLDVMAEEFKKSREVLEAHGGFVKNASRFTKLEAWDRVDFDVLVPAAAG